MAKVLVEEKLSLGSCLQLQRVSPLSWWGEWQQADRHGAGVVAESFISGSTGSKERYWAWHGILKV